MNGLDLVFVVVGLLLLKVSWHWYIKYYNWSMEDKDRRRERRLARLEIREMMEEKEYRRHLRLIFRLTCFTTGMVHIYASSEKAIKAFKHFESLLKNLNVDAVGEPYDERSPSV